MNKKIITSLLTFILFIPYTGKASTIPPPPVYNPTLVFQTGNATENTGIEQLYYDDIKAQIIKRLAYLDSTRR
jgi:hypothetical protein